MGPAALCPPEAQTLGLSQGDQGRGRSSWVLPLMASSARGDRDCDAWEGGKGGNRGRKSYQDAILGNRGVRTSWVKANQAMAMRLPAMPP